MTELKCPICNTPLEYDIGYDGDYSCEKCGRATMYGSEELWQALIDTKNKLDSAIDALEYANKCIKGGCVNWETYIDKALEQINEITKGGKDEPRQI